MNQEKLTLLGAIPELGTLDRYFTNCISNQLDVDPDIAFTFAKKVQERIEELTNTYNLEVDREEYAWCEDLIHFVKSEPEMIKAPPTESDGLDDGMTEIAAFLELLKYCSNGKGEIIPSHMSCIFLLLVRAVKEKAEFFQEKYKWDFSIKEAPETSGGEEEEK